MRYFDSHPYLNCHILAAILIFIFMNEILQLRSEIKQHASPIYCLSKGGEEHLFFTGGADQYVALWNLKTIKQEKLSIKLDSTVYSLCYIPFSNQLWIGLGNGSIHVIDLSTKTEIKHFKAHQSAVFHLNFSSRNKKVFSSGADGLFCVWDIELLKLNLALPISLEKIRKIKLNQDESLLVLAAGDEMIRVFETEYFNEVHSFKAHDLGVNSLCFIDENRLLSGGKDAHLNVWDLKNSFKLIQSIPAHNFAVYAIEKSPCGNYFATASRDKTIKIWDANSMKVLQRIDRKNNGHQNSVNDLLWQNYQQVLISVGDDRAIKVWENKIQ